jgi:hypothetical protein
MRNNLEKSEEKRIQDSIRAAEESRARSSEVAAVMNKNQDLIEVVKGQSEKIEEQSKMIDTLKWLFNAPSAGNRLYETYNDAIYILEVVSLEIVMPDGSSSKLDSKWTGSAFLGRDGKLMTARHCIQAWRYTWDDDYKGINYAELNGGKVIVKFRVTSSKNWFEFNYTDVILDDSKDELIVQKVEIGKRRKKKDVEIYYKYASVDKTDWAYIQTGRNSDIRYGKEQSLNLLAGEDLFILGFSLGRVHRAESEINPLFSDTKVALDGISPIGLITITNTGFDTDNSGSPVFMKSGNSFLCVGIISFVKYDNKSRLYDVGGVVPIANVK